MSNPWIEKAFNGINDDYFDDIIKCLDFPLEDVEVIDGGGSGQDVIKENNGGCEEWDCNFQNLEPPPANVLAGLSSGFCGDFFSDSLIKPLPVSVSSHCSPLTLVLTGIHINDYSFYLEVGDFNLCIAAKYRWNSFLDLFFS